MCSNTSDRKYILHLFFKIPTSLHLKTHSLKTKKEIVYNLLLKVKKENGLHKLLEVFSIENIKKFAGTKDSYHRSSL